MNFATIYSCAKETRGKETWRKETGGKETWRKENWGKDLNYFLKCLLWWLIKLGFWMKETFLEMTVLVFAEERGSSTKR